MALIELGKVAKPHGFRGEFVVITDSGKYSTLSNATRVFLGKTCKSAVPYTVISASWMTKGWKVKLQGIDSDGAVKLLRGNSLFVDRCELPALSTNEYYIGDLVGCVAVDSESTEKIGVVAKIETAAIPEFIFQDRWVVSTEAGELVIPSVRRFIHRIDLERREIWLCNLSELR